LRAKKRKFFLFSSQNFFASCSQNYARVLAMNERIIKVLNAGEVSLLSHFGDDLSVVNAAKVSFASHEVEMNDKAQGLINFLIKNKHATPFEHCVFKFYIKCPIFVAREWFRHRWSSFNEMSMRYHVPSKIDFFYPEIESIRQQTGKPGNYTFEQFDNQKEMYELTISSLEKVYNNAEETYRELINAGVAKELARSVLPVGQYTEFIWTVNARSLINFDTDRYIRNNDFYTFKIKEEEMHSNK
jgi:thymidylate synthase (FAD)